MSFVLFQKMMDKDASLVKDFNELFTFLRMSFFGAQSVADVSNMLHHVQASYIFSVLFLCIYTSSYVLIFIYVVFSGSQTVISVSSFLKSPRSIVELT